jgi:HAD superfamily hydrolase (TIGR01450 family)
MTCKGVMFDLDGTLILSDRDLGGYRVLPHAIDTLTELDQRGIPFVAMTNGSAFPASVQAAKLAALGLPIDAARLMTPNTVAAKVFADRGHSRVLVLGTPGVREALEAESINTGAPGEHGPYNAVYVAWHPDCAMPDIHAACEAVIAGAKLYSASDVPFFATQSGRAFGYSCAIGGAIARVTGGEPEVTGKPSLHALEAVAVRLGVAPSEVLVVGDDPRVETEMARSGGATGVGVTTGTTSRGEWAAQPPARAAHHVIDSLSDLLGLGLLEPETA